jgi:hypothetical protein
LLAVAAEVRFLAAPGATEKKAELNFPKCRRRGSGSG